MQASTLPPTVSTGVCEALREAGRDGKVRVIAYDVTPQNIDELRQGTISILIDQTAREQGSRPLMLLRDFILYGDGPSTPSATPASRSRLAIICKVSEKCPCFCLN